MHLTDDDHNLKNAQVAPATLRRAGRGLDPSDMSLTKILSCLTLPVNEISLKHVEVGQFVFDPSCSIESLRMIASQGHDLSALPFNSRGDTACHLAAAYGLDATLD